MISFLRDTFSISSNPIEANIFAPLINALSPFVLAAAWQNSFVWPTKLDGPILMCGV